MEPNKFRCHMFLFALLALSPRIKHNKRLKNNGTTEKQRKPG